MKIKVLLTLASAALLMNISLSPNDSLRLTLLGGAAAHARVSVSFDFFYNELAPYGEWRPLDPYGWVWYPDVADDWRPYTLGHWVFTDDFGWTWISTEPWGSIPFHYGRWFYDDNYGSWAWVPGTEWGPAWVSWRSGGGFIGWAPLPPSVRFKPGISFFSPRQDAGIRRKDWCFVPTSQFLNPRLRQVIAPPRRNINLIENTTNVTRYLVVNQRIVNRSIDFDRFEVETRTRVPRYRVIETDRPMVRETPVREGQVMLFRPQIVRTNTPPPPAAIRTPGWRTGPRDYDYDSERRAPDVAPRTYRGRDDDQDWRDDREPLDTDRRFSKNPRSPEFEGRDEQRPRMEQEQTRQRAEREQQRQQQREQEQARQRAEREQQRQQQVEQEKARQQAEREQQRQQQREQEQARQRAEREQQRQQQREQEQARQRAERQQQRQQQREQEQSIVDPQQPPAEQERQRQRQPGSSQNRRERLPACQDLPPEQQQNCR